MVANEAAETEARSRLIPKQILQWHQYDQKWQRLQQTAGLHFIFLTPTEQIKHFDTMWFKNRFLGEGGKFPTTFPETRNEKELINYPWLWRIKSGNTSNMTHKDSSSHSCHLNNINKTLHLFCNNYIESIWMAFTVHSIKNPRCNH